MQFFFFEQFFYVYSGKTGKFSSQFYCCIVNCYSIICWRSYYEMQLATFFLMQIVVFGIASFDPLSNIKEILLEIGFIVWMRTA